MINKVSGQFEQEKSISPDELMKLPDKAILVGIYVLLDTLVEAFAAYLRKPS